MAKEKLICNCNRTMPLDARTLGRSLNSGTPVTIHTELCRRGVAAFEAAVKKGGDLLVACTQEAPLFAELHEQLKGAGRMTFANIRETGGWSEQGGAAAPKVAALLALADLPEPEAVPAVSYESRGETLIIGPGAAALGWAERLAGQLSVSVLVTDPGGCEMPAERRYPVFSGDTVSVAGYLGAFSVAWRQSNPIDLEVCTRCNACIRACPEQAIDLSYQIDPARCQAHRQCVKVCGDIRAIDFDRASPERSERFDLVLDLSSEPLIRSSQPPQGYYAPGADPLAQALAVQQLAQHVGEFEKPRFFEYRQNVCAHARSGIAGCTRCLEICSTNAISSDMKENRVSVEPHLCMGCGGCSTVCPSGAMSYAYPRLADMGVRVKTVLQVYREAGGENPCLLFHNGSDGRDLVARLARRGRGLPAAVIPLEVHHVASLGPDLLLGCIAFGASRVIVLSAGSEPEAYHEALERQCGFAQDVVSGLGLGEDRFAFVKTDDFESLERTLWEAPVPTALAPAAFNLSNDKRGTLDFIFDHLLRRAPIHRDEVPLRAGAPYGTVQVDRQKCTLCLACVGACPEGALLDAKDQPQLRFIERNCVQCGLCAKTCPEDAISLAPRLLLSPEALQARVMNEDKVLECARCGKPFASQRIVENMVARLTSHSMFRDPAALNRLRMCQDCRVADMFERHDGATIFDVTDGVK